MLRCAATPHTRPEDAPLRMLPARIESHPLSFLAPLPVLSRSHGTDAEIPDRTALSCGPALPPSRSNVVLAISAQAKTHTPCPGPPRAWRGGGGGGSDATMLSQGSSSSKNDAPRDVLNFGPGISASAAYALTSPPSSRAPSRRPAGESAPEMCQCTGAHKPVSGSRVGVGVNAWGLVFTGRHERMLASWLPCRNRKGKWKGRSTHCGVV